MAEENGTGQIVRKYINKYNINNGNYEQLRPNLKKQLSKIEKYIQHCIKTQQDLASRIKDSKLHIAKMSSGIGLSRGTIYNNRDTLKKYIEGRIKEVESEDILSVNKMLKQQQEVEQLRDYLDKTQLHLVQNEINESKIEELEDYVDHLVKIQQAHVEKISKSESENMELVYKLRRKGESNVIAIFLNVKEDDYHEYVIHNHYYDIIG
jgi:hypothetical protein